MKKPKNISNSKEVSGELNRLFLSLPSPNASSAIFERGTVKGPFKFGAKFTIIPKVRCTPNAGSEESGMAKKLSCSFKFDAYCPEAVDSYGETPYIAKIPLSALASEQDENGNQALVVPAKSQIQFFVLTETHSLVKFFYFDLELNGSSSKNLEDRTLSHENVYVQQRIFQLESSYSCKVIRYLLRFKLKISHSESNHYLLNGPIHLMFNNNGLFDLWNCQVENKIYFE